jgi:ERCC4-type nuclease
MVTCKPPSARYDTLRSGGQRGHGQDVAGLDLYVCPFTVLVDTREQAPWTFQQIVIERRLWTITRIASTLATGDYTIAGCEDRLCVERKSAADLVGSVTAGNARFRREHERMQVVVESGGFACVIVEGSLSAICDELDADAGRKVTSESVLGAVASWPQRYRVPWFFAGDRRTAERLAFKIMLKWWKEHASE